MPFVTNLDTPLLRLSAHDNFTLAHGCQGVHVFGGIGSGKTSGSGRMLSGAFLRAGFGGLITAVKPEEVELWVRYAQEHGREKSLILFNENEGFNFLRYEMARQGADGIGTVTECLMRIIESAKRASPTASQRGGEAFWEDSARQAIRRTILPVHSVHGTLSIPEIARFINTAPTSINDVRNPDWQKRSFMYGVMDAAARQPKVPLAKDVLEDAINFWAEQWPAIPEKTRGNIVITVTSALDRFLHGRLARAFCGGTSVVPEMTFHGAIIVLAMATLTWNEDGIVAQQLFKYMWQRAVLTRNSLPKEHRERPVFLWSDEAQETVHSYDAEFMSLARASRCCPVYLTQSLPSYYAKMGGDNPRDDAHSLVGKFTTHIYHSNACPETNEYASRMIGKEMTRRRNVSRGSSESFNEGMSAGNSENRGSSSSHGSNSGQGYSVNSSSGSTSGTGTNWGSNRGRGLSDNVSRGYSESMENVIEPGEFARILKTGGAANGNIVTGIWFQSGRIFKTSGGNMMLRRFAQ
jgi:TraM recognition site of TraD and TraG